MRWIKQNKAESYLRVDKWFAWYPVTVGMSMTHYAWLERVWRKRRYEPRYMNPVTTYEYINLEDQFME